MSITALNDTTPTTQMAMTGLGTKIDIVVPSFAISVMRLVYLKHYCTPQSSVYGCKNMYTVAASHDYRVANLYWDLRLHVL